MNLIYTTQSSPIDGLPPIFAPDQGVNPKSLIPPVITTPAYDLDWSYSTNTVPSFINRSSQIVMNEMDTPWETTNEQSRLRLDETKYNIMPRTEIMANPEKVLTDYERKLFLQTISPGQYLYNMEIYPLNSNIGISYTPQDPPLFKDPLFNENNGSRNVIFTRIDPQLIRDNVPPEVKDVLPKRDGKTMKPSPLNAVSSPNFQTDRYLMESVDQTYNALAPSLMNVGTSWHSNYDDLPPIRMSSDIYSVIPAERRVPEYSIPLVNQKQTIDVPLNAESSGSFMSPKQANGIPPKQESFKEGYGGFTTLLKEPQVFKTLSQPPIESMYDPRWRNYGDPSRAYSDMNLGNVDYYYQDIDPYYKPNFIIRSKIDHVEFIDPMDRTLPEYYPNYSLEDMKQIAEDAYMRDTLFHREDMMAQLSKKMLQRQWQTRYAPIRQDLMKK